ncbi:MAG: methylenetetrahydrofolate--tRNA-(uracil(54)-C(5))-methyltransferase (FADH(2)-oxidizing) TrmFO [Clostridia bacterium]|jgi:methylenetetrahydrofolate--tRNA-(uracil-5-)-methyltransferase|nr:methylenetetrahydrofolate--tRNA-(uracil(54)-C(5))-methyltransferase (FADH(2)-oxidizing) TrmFO [Clostridia bacterium]MCI9291310.1 methylenetetrahydrofolate--tRNA-(uracil(54)-C(5))-methyltransferase (FADH(2)-oxidizing) TrmFO [Clostridia bacterium]
MKVNVIGGGLAGCESAYQLLKRGYQVDLYEMRGVGRTPCHSTTHLAELVCSNSLKAQSIDNASGLLKYELARLDSIILKCAYQCDVPAGGALAVDREKLSRKVEEILHSFDGFRLIREDVEDVDMDIPTVIATGPLTSKGMSDWIASSLGGEYLSFYDAVAPIIDGESIDYDKAFFAARYGKGGDDYLNCAMDKEEYLAFYDALINAERAKLKDFEFEVFERCMPIEVMASRGIDTMRYGPLRPVGIRDPRREGRPYAVVQLRKEKREGNAYNIVGFQTNLKFAEQKRVFSMIPGLERAEFLRYGVMHANTFINAPKVLDSAWALKDNKHIFFAGQLTGVEGYMESAASGLVAGINLARRLGGKSDMIMPDVSIIGQLQRHISTPVDDYQPMNANFGILPALNDPPRDKKQRKYKYSLRCIAAVESYLKDINE